MPARDEGHAATSPAPGRDACDERKLLESSGTGSSTLSFCVDEPPAVQEAAVSRKLGWRILAPFCLVTLLSHMDRANLAFASTQLNADLGFSEEVYGTASSCFFISYMAFQIPSQLAAERCGLARWLAALLVVWGCVAASFAALTPARAHLYALRFLLGAAEAGTFPAMFAYLTRFYAGGPALAAAWGWIGAAQPMAQVLGAPAAAALLMADGFLGLRGWRWLFLMEGLPTVALGVWIGLALADGPAKAAYLSPQERAHVAASVQRSREAVQAGAGEAQHWTRGVACWKVWAQGVGSAWTGILRFGGMYWTPLIVYRIVYGREEPGATHSAAKSAASALLSGIPYSWAAAATLLNARQAKRTGGMYWLLLWPLAIGSAGLLLLALSLGSLAGVAFAGLVIAATSQASNPLEWAYPATYLQGAALSAGWALANCIAASGGIVGPWLIGVLKAASGSYVAPMLTLAAVNAAALAYFALLLPHLPVRSRRPAGEAAAAAEEGGDREALVDRESNVR